MPKSKDQKKQIVKDFSEKLEKSKSVIFVEYPGLAVSDITDLRKKLKKEKSDFKVVKNTLVLQGLKKAGKEDWAKAEFLGAKGAKAVVFNYEDPAQPVKSIYLFSRQHKMLKFIGGFLDGSILNKSDVTALAMLPSRQELLAKVVGTINAPVSGFVNVLAGTMRGLVYTLQAIGKNKK